MRFDDALAWYRQDRFTAADVARATGLNERAQRELQKLGLIQSIRQTNPKAQRLLNSLMVKRSAIIASLANTGLSLGVAGRMVCAAYQLEGLIFTIVDPLHAYFDPASFDKKINRHTRLREKPHIRETWFDPDFPPSVSAGDYCIALANSRFAMLGVGEKAATFGEALGTYGELSSGLTEFIWWKDAVYDFIKHLEHDSRVQLGVYGINERIFQLARRSNNPQVIYINVKKPSEADEQQAEKAIRNPTSLLKINASLALRIALRRLLHIDPPAEKF